MRYKTTWYPLNSDETVEEWFDTLEEVAQAIIDNAAEWENTARNFYIDWVSG